jgi:hypothetical protein
MVETTPIDLAAFTAAVQRAGDDWPPLLWHIGNLTVPADATPVEQVEPPAKAWVGTDPASGQPMLWVIIPGRDDVDTSAASGEGWSQEQLVHLLLTGERG